MPSRVTPGLVFCALLAALALAACGGGGGSSTGAAPPSPPTTPTTPTATQSPGPMTVAVHHVIVIVQENRTVDNLFAGLPGADTQYPPHYQTLPLYSVWDPNHDYDAFVAQYRGDWVPQTLSVVRRSDVQPYWTLVSLYGFADEMLQSSEGESYPAHQYLIAGQSGRDAPGGTWSISQNPFPTGQIYGGCNMNPHTYANQIDLSRPWPAGQTNPTFPCVDYETIFDLLDHAGLTWKYYTFGDTNNFFTAPLGVKHLYDSGEAESHLAMPPEASLCNDIAGGTLPAVSYMVDRASLNDHGSTGTTDGPKWIATVANMIGASRYWDDTTILVTWDDWGGWYDHVMPRVISSFEYGFRVPLLVVSPWLRHRGLISHVPRDQAAILHYIESVFNLPTLRTLDAKTDDLRDMFVKIGTKATPLAYQPISVDRAPSYFCSLPPVEPRDLERE